MLNPNISLIKVIYQKHIFGRFTLGLTQGQFCPKIFTDSFLRRKPNEL